jgi:hypothetical protein
MVRVFRAFPGFSEPGFRLPQDKIAVFTWILLNNYRLILDGTSKFSI